MKYTIIAAAALLAMGSAQAQTAPQQQAPAAGQQEVKVAATEPTTTEAPTVPVQSKKPVRTTSIVLGALGAVAAIGAANGMGGGGSSSSKPSSP